MTCRLRPPLARSNVAREREKIGIQGMDLGDDSSSTLLHATTIWASFDRLAHKGRPETTVVGRVVTHLRRSPPETHRMLPTRHSFEPHRLGLSIALKMSSRRLEEDREIYSSLPERTNVGTGSATSKISFSTKKTASDVGQKSSSKVDHGDSFYTVLCLR